MFSMGSSYGSDGFELNMAPDDAKFKFYVTIDKTSTSQSF